jgi:hypothetical protein
MKAITFLTPAAALLLVSCTTFPAPGANPAREAELAKAVEGRVAGQAVNCINLREISTSRIVDGTAIIYAMSNGTLYVNRPTSGASTLRRDDVLVSDTHSGQLCNIDIVRLQDSSTQTEAGFVGLAKFVPYPRADRSRS